MDLAEKYINNAKEQLKEIPGCFDELYKPYIDIINTLACDGILELIIRDENKDFYSKSAYHLFQDIVFLNYYFKQTDYKTLKFLSKRYHLTKAHIKLPVLGGITVIEYLIKNDLFHILHVIYEKNDIYGYFPYGYLHRYRSDKTLIRKIGKTYGPKLPLYVMDNYCSEKIKQSSLNQRVLNHSTLLNMIIIDLAKYYIYTCNILCLKQILDHERFSCKDYPNEFNILFDMAVESDIKKIIDIFINYY